MVKRYQFPLLFLLVYGVLQLLYLNAPEWLVKDMLVERLTAEPAAWLINWLWPSAQALAHGGSIVSPRGTLNILRGCEGTETLLMLLAAVFAARRMWRQLLLGVVLGCALVYLLNQVRIVGLYWIVVHHHDLFSLFHGTIAPLFIVGLSLGFFILWSRYPSRRAEVSHVPGA